MASSRKVGADAMAREVWRALFDVLVRSAPVRARSLARRGLSPNDSRALFSLDAQSGRAMRTLADEWDCDPSYATWIVDRLEGLGLAKRRVESHDRRIKLVVLTRKGQNTRTELLREFHEPPPEIARLSKGDLTVLRRLISKMPPT